MKTIKYYIIFIFFLASSVILGGDCLFGSKSISQDEILFFDALVTGDFQQVQYFVEKDSNNIHMVFGHRYFNDRYNELSKERRLVFGFMPIHLAALSGHFNIVEYLIGKKGVDVNIKSDYPTQVMPLYCASQEGCEKVVKYFLDKSANIDEKMEMKEDKTALHIAAEKGYVNIVRILLDSGATVNRKSNDKSIALHYALKEDYACKDYFEIVRYLVQKGANVNAQDFIGRTPLYWATKKKRFACIRNIIEHGAKIDQKSWKEARNVSEENPEILNYFKTVQEFDSSQKLSFIAERETDKDAIKNSIYMVLRRVLFLQNKMGDNGEFYVNFWDKMQSNKRLRDRVFCALEIDEVCAIKQYHKIVLNEVKKSGLKLNQQKVFAITKTVFGNKCKESCKQNLIQLFKNGEFFAKTKKTFAKNAVSIQCLI